jgi:hypothetical protein
MRSALVFLIFLCFGKGLSQQALRISWRGVFGHKTREIYSGEDLKYKLKGECRFRHNRIYAMKDSTIFLDDDSQIRLSQIKTIRYHKHLRIQEALGKFLIDLGILFIVVDTANNLITDKDVVVNSKAVYAAAALCSAGILLRISQQKTLRTGKRKVMQIIDMDYQDLNHK